MNPQNPDTYRVAQILETCLYVDDLDQAEAFYQRVLGFQFVSRQPERHVFLKTEHQMLLLFQPDETLKPDDLPAHGAKGPGHIAFSMRADQVEGWVKRLSELGVEIEHRVEWKHGATSLYFRDPAGNSLELATPSLWGFPEA